MNLNNLESGYWTCCEDHFVKCYKTLEEAKKHIGFQHTTLGNQNKWYIVKIDFSFIENERKTYEF